MGLFGRIWRTIKGWLLIGVEKAEDPEVILAEAQDAMKQELARAKENAVEAIAARNELRNVLQRQEETSADMEAKARAALKMGNEDLARQLLIEKATYDQNIEKLRVQLQQAEQVSENVKQHIKAMEAQVRTRAAQRLALVAGWKQAKIQESLNRALDGMSLDGHDQAFQRAQERIESMQAKADAREEMAQGGLQREIQKLGNAQASQAADEALSKMKSQMGLAPAAEEDALSRLKAEISQEPAQQPLQQG